MSESGEGTGPYELIGREVQTRLESPQPVQSPVEKLRGEDREHVEEIRIKIDALRERHWTLKSGLLKNFDSQDALFLPEQSELKELSNQNRELLDQIDGNFKDTVKVIAETVDIAIASALEANIDINTPLLGRRGAERAGVKFLNGAPEIKGPNGERIPLDPNKFHVYFQLLDGMLFHAGNTLLGPLDFDRRIAQSAKAEIALSRVIAGSTGLSPYGRSESIDQEPDLLAYAPEGSRMRAAVDKIVALNKSALEVGDDGYSSGEFVESFQFRVNLGGSDEFGRVFMVYSDNADKLCSDAEITFRSIVKMTTLNKEVKVLPENSMDRTLSERDIAIRQRFRDFYPTAVNSLRFSSGILEADQETALTGFLDGMQTYLATSQRKTDVFFDPQNDITMDMAECHLEIRLPDLDDATELFLYGTDKNGNRLKNPDGTEAFGLYTNEGLPDMGKITLLADKIAERILTSAISSEDTPLTDERISAITSAVVNEQVMINLIDVLNGQVNNVSKAEKKAEVLSMALSPNQFPDMMFNVGATLGTGRASFVDMDDFSKVRTLVGLIRVYEGSYYGDSELANDQELRTFMKQWEEVKRSTGFDVESFALVDRRADQRTRD